MRSTSVNFKTQFKKDIFSTVNSGFEKKAIELFQYQAVHCEPYRKFLEYLPLQPADVCHIHDIPFLPVEVFKTHEVITSPASKPELIFRSSGTTDRNRSVHYVTDPEIYKQSALRCFELFFGNPQQFEFLALLPGYIERPDASLIWMVKVLMQESGSSEDGFYINDPEALKQKITFLQKSNKPVILFGVSHALLDFAEKFPGLLENVKIIETGGMKGRKKELVRASLHHTLGDAFNLESIASEYGMTEMLTQAYALKDGIFYTPPWLEILIRDPHDHLEVLENGVHGAINIIDLANVDSCAFLATKDIGIRYPGGKFEVLGRMDNSDIRGCNLLLIE